MPTSGAGERLHPPSQHKDKIENVALLARNIGPDVATNNKCPSLDKGIISQRRGPVARQAYSDAYNPVSVAGSRGVRNLASVSIK